MFRRVFCASVAVLLFASFFLAPATIHGTAAKHLLISEVLYDPASQEPGSEFVEIFNPTDLPASVEGWALQDNSSSDPLPRATIAPGQFLVVTANQADFLAANPGFSGQLVALESNIGNGLSNSGDRVSLVDHAGTIVDAMSYGSDARVFSPSCSDVREGQSLSRTASDSDSDSASDWSPGVPSPGAGWSPLPEPMSTQTLTASPTFAATGTSTPSKTPSPAHTWTPTKTPSPTDDETVSATPTSSPTASPSPIESETPGVTPLPGSWPRLLISEVFYDPPQAGTDSSFEFVEIFNPTGQTVAVGGWSVADNGGKDELPAASILPGDYVILAASRDGLLANFPSFSGNLVSLGNPIGNGLANTGDRVTLLAPDGIEIDEMSYGSDTSAFDPACRDVAAGESLARIPSGLDTDTATDWYGQSEPNPGASGTIHNTPTPTPSSTPTATRTRTATKTASTTRTPTSTPKASRTLSVTPTPSPTGSTPTPTTTRTPTRTVSPTPSSTPTFPAVWPKVLLSEVLYDPQQEGSDADWEFVELHNPGAAAITLSGWRIADNTSQDILPEFTLGAGGHAVVVAKDAAFRNNFPTFAGQLVSLEGSIGNGLGNTGDAVRLVAPDSSVIDAMSYGSDKSVFDPPCPKAGPGESLTRWSEIDNNSAADWVVEPSPHPGVAASVTPTPTADLQATPTATATRTVTRTPGATRTATATRTPQLTAAPTALSPDALMVTLNEILPNPRSVDWDRDGQAGFADEWVELHNASDGPVGLEGWQISNDRAGYRIPAGIVIWPHSYLLLYRSQSHLSLSDWRDTVTLSRSDGTRADAVTYDHDPGADRSYCRNVDGNGWWTRECEVTPGGPNRLLPPAPPAAPGAGSSATTIPRTVAAARGAEEDTRAVITGTVTVPPGLLERAIYVQDSTGGIKVFLRKGDYPTMKLGDVVRVSGWTRNFYGETELSLPDPGYLAVLRPGSPVEPKMITSAGLSEPNEGSLVQVVGVVIKYEPRGLMLKDQGGLIPVYFPETLPWRRPYVRLGDLWGAQGVLGQSVGDHSTGSGYRIVPRFKSDVSTAPLTLPETGGAERR